MTKTKDLQRFSGTHCPILLLVLAGLTCASLSHACDVPVFRYSVERWVADVFEILVLHRGELSPEQKEPVDRFEKAIDEGNLTVNCRIDVIDLSSEEGAKMEAHLPEGEIGSLPWVLVMLPTLKWADGVIWSGPLSEESIKEAIDSPVRQEIAKKITGGDTAVWILLESGDEEKDSEARETLNKNLAELVNTLEVSRPAPLDVGGGAEDVPEEPEEIPLSFPVIPVKKTDPSERFFVDMLLKCEPDLEDETYASMPMAFPIFGRGRILYALVGPGITDRNIEEACQFLTGPCSCEVKELNPGMDLLIAADWENYKGDPLVDDFLGTPAEAEATTLAASNSSFFRNTIVSLLVLTLIVFGGTIFVFRRSEN